ncbi:class I SAM-dependent methyltransferase [Erysipelothrix sp. HDW6A]|nr:class I SAM-dependent methyltransferase [Erysipelothrix sp. HDW6A]
MSHYFTDNSNLKTNRKEIPFRFLGYEYVMTSDDGVFSKEGLDRGTEALLKVLVSEELGTNICDVGCGIGVIGVILSQYFESSFAGIDVNPRALELAKINYKRNNVKGDLYLQDGLTKDMKFDTIVTNPPIRVGKEKVYELFDQIYEALEIGGRFYFVMRKSHGAKSAEAKCIESFGNCKLLKKDKGFYIYVVFKH